MVAIRGDGHHGRPQQQGRNQVIPSFVLRSALMAAAIAITSATPLAVQGQEPAPPTGPVRIGAGAADQNPMPWTVNCSSQGPAADLVCNMSQVLIAQETGQRIVGATVFRQPGGAAVMRLNLPHGLMLQSGVDTWVDTGAVTNRPIVTADQNGSYADIELSGQVAQALQAGGALNLGVTTISGERIEFAFSLRGFTAAFAKL